MSSKNTNGLTDKERLAEAESLHADNRNQHGLLAFGADRVALLSYRALKGSGCVVALFGTASASEQERALSDKMPLADALDVANVILLMPSSAELRGFGKGLIDIANEMDRQALANDTPEDVR